jgi:hypothetical protein
VSLHEYRVSTLPELNTAPFYALIMAAMRQADTLNTIKLRSMWPEVWDELCVRYHAPGGLLESERAATGTEGGQG